MSWTVVVALTLLYWSALLVRARRRSRNDLARAVEQSASAHTVGQSCTVGVPIEINVPRAIGRLVVVPIMLIIVRVLLHAAH